MSVSSALADEAEFLISGFSFARFLFGFRQMKEESLKIIHFLENLSLTTPPYSAWLLVLEEIFCVSQGNKDEVYRLRNLAFLTPLLLLT